MSMKQLSISPEINMGDVLQAMVDDFETDDFIDFVDELIDQIADGDFMNQLYELLRQKHENWLDEMDVSENEYQTDYVHDPSLYPDAEIEDDGIEFYNSDNDNDNDNDNDEDEWITDPDNIDDDENPLDVFTTE